MLSIEEYIAQRKREDSLNEFDADLRIDNMRMIVNYVFEFFNNYINITPEEEKTALQNEKIAKYANMLNDYDLEIREWLIRIYTDYDKRLNRNIGTILKNYEFFLLYNKDSEFRSISYDCYSELIKKMPFLRDQTEMLFLFIKDYHRVQSQRGEKNHSIPFISDNITDWLETTWTKYQISILTFVDNWVMYFYDNKELWPRTHRIKSNDPAVKYEYNYKQKSNLFNLDSLYRKMPKKPYVKGKKQELEILMVYYWLHSADGNNSYWQEYLDKTLPTID